MTFFGGIYSGPPRKGPSICFKCSETIYPRCQAFEREWDTDLVVMVHAEVYHCHRCDEIQSSNTDIKVLSLLACYAGLLEGVWTKRMIAMVRLCAQLTAWDMAIEMGVRERDIRRAIDGNVMLEDGARQALIRYLERKLPEHLCTF